MFWTATPTIPLLAGSGGPQESNSNCSDRGKLFSRVREAHNATKLTKTDQWNSFLFQTLSDRAKVDLSGISGW